MYLLGSVLENIYSVTAIQWALLFLTVSYFTWRNIKAPFLQYSNLPQVAPHWFLGNKSFGGESLMDNMLNHYHALGDNRFGLYWDGRRPTLFLKDIDLIKKVQIGDFDHFTDFGFNHPEYLEKVGNVFGIADMQGEHWKKMKKMVTPSFSVPRLKKTVPSMNIAAEKLVDYLKTVEKKEFVNAVEFTRKFYMTTIASVAFGLDIDCYGEKESKFETMGKNLIAVWRFLIVELFPSLAILLKIKIINPKSELFFSNLCKRLVRDRKSRKIEVRDVLGNLMNVAEENPDMTEEMMYKTCVQFFTDGYDTASQALSVLMYHLARNPDIQERVHEEIDAIFDEKNEGDHIDERDLSNMPYLDQVLSEGLRVGAVPFTARYCTKPWRIPDDTFVVPKDMKVFIPIAGLHYDEKFWEEPYKFDPERFSPENKGKITGAVYQPFGFGARACLGQNLMKIETKIMLTQLLRNFSLTPFGPSPERMVWDVDAIIGSNNVNIKVSSRL